MGNRLVGRGPGAGVVGGRTGSPMRRGMGVAALVSACAVVLGACVGPGSSKWLFGSWDAVGTVEVPYLPIAQAVGPADGGGILIGGLASSTYQAKAVRVSPAGDVVYDVPLGLGAVNRTVSDARGDLFIGSTTDTRNDVRPALWRFSPSGAPDDSFGAAGVVSFDPPPPQLPPNPYIAELTDFLRASAIAAAVDDSGRTYVLVSSLRGRTWNHRSSSCSWADSSPTGRPTLHGASTDSSTSDPTSSSTETRPRRAP